MKKFEDTINNDSIHGVIKIDDLTQSTKERNFCDFILDEKHYIVLTSKTNRF